MSSISIERRKAMSYDIFVSNLEEMIARAERGEWDEEDIERGINRATSSNSISNFLTGLSASLSSGKKSNSESERKIIDSPVPQHLTVYRSSFASLSGSLDYLMRSNILTCLQSHEICMIGSTCKYFQHLCAQPSIWHTLYKRDFLPLDTMVTQTRNTIIAAADSRAMYLTRYQEYKTRVSRSKEEAKQIERNVRRSVLVGRIERLIDITQVRLCGPLLLASLFLSIILFCQKVDGLAISYWSCAVPLAVSILYVMGSMCFLRYIQRQEFNATSVFRSLWSYVRGPLPSMYKSGLGESCVMLSLCMFLLVCLLVQLGLLVVKLSLYIPRSFRNDLSWSLVFLPVWIFFVLFWVIQCTKYRLEAPVFIGTLIMFWMPFLILFVCLTIKLEYKNDGKGAIRLAFMLIPFYVIEGFFMLWSAVALIIAYLRYGVSVRCIYVCIYVCMYVCMYVLVWVWVWVWVVWACVCVWMTEYYSHP
ncbi:hypothetical protein EON65_12680 [archaeon]|nr:MAG: hypothetical protein EON65_12680 [archaeon]